MIRPRVYVNHITRGLLGKRANKAQTYQDSERTDLRLESPMTIPFAYGKLL